MTNAVIGFPRWTEEFVWGGGDWSVDYPPANLNLLPLSRVARSNGLVAGATRLVGVLPTSRGVRLFGLIRHNLSTTATFRIRLYRDAAATELAHDTGDLDAWPVVYPFGIPEWEDDQFWAGRYAAQEIAGYTWSRPVWLDRIYLIRAVVIDFADPANPSGHIDIGMIDVAQGWQVGLNFDLGAEFGFRGRTGEVETLGGAKIHDRRPKPRVWRGAISALDRDEALARALEHQRRLDTDQPFYWVPHPEEPIHWFRTTFLARNTTLGLMRYAAPDRTNVSLSFEEVL